MLIIVDVSKCDVPSGMAREPTARKFIDHDEVLTESAEQSIYKALKRKWPTCVAKTPSPWQS